MSDLHESGKRTPEEKREARRPPPEPRRWRRVSRGLIFLLFGTFLLLTTLDVLPWSYWGDLMPFWPVLLVMLGLRLMFERSRVPWAILLSPLVLLVTMAWVAVEAPTYSYGPPHGVHADRAPEAERWRLQGDLAMARLRIDARTLPAGALLDGEVRGRRGTPWVSVMGGGESPRVRLRNLRSGTFLPLYGRWRSEIAASVTDDLPLTLAVDGAVIDGEFDLVTVPVRRADFEGAFLELTLRLGPPSEDTEVRLDGAFNRVHLIVPDGTPVHYDTEGAINVVRSRDGRSSTGPGYRLHVEGFCNWVTVRSD